MAFRCSAGEAFKVFRTAHPSNVIYKFGALDGDVGSAVDILNEKQREDDEHSQTPAVLGFHPSLWTALELRRHF